MGGFWSMSNLLLQGRGAGVETALTPNWTFKIEYLHVDLGSRQMFNTVPGVPETVRFTADIVRVDVNYRLY